MISIFHGYILLIIINKIIINNINEILSHKKFNIFIYATNQPIIINNNSYTTYYKIGLELNICHENLELQVYN